MKIDTYKSNDIPYGEDGYLERTIETYYDYPPTKSEYLTSKLFDDVEKHFNSMLSDIEEKAFIRSTFVLPSTLMSRKTSKKFMVDRNGKLKESNVLKEIHYFPYEVKKVILDRLEELAKENNYYIKLYYDSEDYNEYYVNVGNILGNGHSIVSCLYTKKRFLENFSNELKQFKELYNNCIEEYNAGYAVISFEILMANLYQRIAGIFNAYGAIPNIKTLIEEAGIVLDVENKSVMLKKVKEK